MVKHGMEMDILKYVWDRMMHQQKNMLYAEIQMFNNKTKLQIKENL